MNVVCLDQFVLNTVATEDFVLKLLLFSICTNEMTAHHRNVRLFKYQDDRVIDCRLLKNNLTHRPGPSVMTLHLFRPGVGEAIWTVV